MLKICRKKSVTVTPKEAKTDLLLFPVMFFGINGLQFQSCKSFSHEMKILTENTKRRKELSENQESARTNKLQLSPTWS